MLDKTETKDTHTSSMLRGRRFTGKSRAEPGHCFSSALFTFIPSKKPFVELLLRLF